MVDKDRKKLSGREINKCVNVFKQAAWKHYISIHIMKSKGSQEKEEQETGRNWGLSGTNKRDKVKPTEAVQAEWNARAGPFKINLHQLLVQCDEKNNPSDESEQNRPHFPTFWLVTSLSPSFMVKVKLILKTKLSMYLCYLDYFLL